MVGFLIAAAFAAGYSCGSTGAIATTGRTARGSGVADPALSDSSLTRFLDTLEADTPAPGTGTITGRVTDLRGKGVAGVLIVAKPWPESTSDRSSRIPQAPRALEFEEQLRRYATRTARNRRRSRRVQSGPDGSYVLPRLVAGKYRVRAYAEGRRIDTTKHHYFAVADSGDTVDFIATSITRIAVDVTFEDGSVAGRAFVRWRRSHATGGGTASSELWTPRSPWIELEEGNYTLSAVLADGSKSKSASSSLSVLAGQSTPRVAFRIDRKPGLRVTVVPPVGFGKFAVQVLVMRFSGAQVPADDLLRASMLQTRGDQDSNDPTVTHFHNLEPGRYLVGAERAQGAGFYVKQVVDVRVPQQELELQLPVPDPAHHVRVRIVDPNGAPLLHVGWGIAHKSKYGWRRYGARGWRRNDGVTLVVLPAEVKGAEGERVVTAKHDSYGTAEANIAGSGPVEIRFAKPAFVDAVLTGYAESGREVRFALSLRHPRYEDFVRGREPDGSGTVRFGPLQPGPYVLGLDKPNAFRGTPALSSTPIVVRPGEQSVSVPIPALHSLRIRWTGEGKPGYLLRKIDPRGPHYQTNADNDGVGLFRDLPPGKYELSVANLDRDIPARVVTIPETSELTLP